MSVFLALMVAASPATTTAEPVEKKPRLKCEWIHEVGTSRPRRICEKRIEKAKPAEQAGEQASDTKQPAPDNSASPQGTSE